jgi:hypothetical protein
MRVRTQQLWPATTIYDSGNVSAGTLSAQLRELEAAKLVADNHDRTCLVQIFEGGTWKDQYRS